MAKLSSNSSDNLIKFGEINLAETPAGELVVALRQHLNVSKKIINQIISDYEDYLTIEDDAESIKIHESELENLHKLKKIISKI